MIELQFINQILNDRSLSLVRQNDINKDHFTAYQQEFEFLEEHYREYGCIPDKTTFIDKFPDFDIVDIQESKRYLVEQLKEQYLFLKMSPAIRKIAELAEEDSREAYTFLKQKIDEFNKISSTYMEGQDLVKDSEDRLQEFKSRQKEDGLLGIKTGIEELDEVTHGWQPEDFVSIIARTSQGKTWLLMFFLVQAWKQGKRVLLYNGELPNHVIGFRFDTLNRHFSNTALTKGDESLNQKYEDYIEELKNMETPFVVIKPRDIKGKLTVSKVEGLIEKYKPDIVGIDQITLMEDERGERGQPSYLKYEHITEDIYQLTEKCAVPILAPHQANRDADSDSDIEDIDDIEVPKISEIYGSDAISHNCRRIITFKKVDLMTKLVLKKNNYGKDNQEILMLWDMDIGLMKPYLTVDKSEGEERVKPVNQDDINLF